MQVPQIHTIGAHIEASDKFDDEWPWPTFQGHIPQTLQNGFHAITCRNFDAGSPNSHQRCPTQRPWTSSMMSDLDLLSKVTDPKDCNMVFEQLLSTSFMQVHQICMVDPPHITYTCPVSPSIPFAIHRPLHHLDQYPAIGQVNHFCTTNHWLSTMTISD